MTDVCRRYRLAWQRRPGTIGNAASERHRPHPLRPAHVSPDDRETWVAMGMAVIAELGADGLTSGIHGPSSRTAISGRRRILRSGKSFRPGKIGIGTLFHEARARAGARMFYVPPDPAIAAAPSGTGRSRRRAKRLPQTAPARSAGGSKAAALWSEASPVGAIGLSRAQGRRGGIGPLFAGRQSGSARRSAAGSRRPWSGFSASPRMATSDFDRDRK